MSQARYWIGKYIPDLFRNEPRNVGVIVDVGGASAARFYGETETGQIDGRSLRGKFNNPDVYRQWIDYWRYAMKSGKIDEMETSNRPSNFVLLKSGEVTDIGGDKPEDVANYLFNLLVENDFSAAINAPTIADAIAFADEVESLFRKANLMETALDNAERRHPIRRNVRIEGTIPYTVDFAQENGALSVMQTVDLRRERKPAFEHAIASAHILQDIRETRTNVKPLVLMRAPDEPSRFTEDIEKVLRKADVEIVSWNEDSQHKLVTRLAI